MITECCDGILILAPQGEVAKIDSPSVAEVAELIRKQKAKKVVFNLDQCDLITSPGFGWMFGIARECKRLGVDVAAYGANTVVARSLKWVNGHLVMEIFKNRAQAMELA